VGPLITIAKIALEHADSLETLMSIQHLMAQARNEWAEHTIRAEWECGRLITELKASEVIQLLRDIRKQRVYKADYATFEDFCEQQLKWDRGLITFLIEVDVL
jgi:hypothetical protein